MTDIFEAASSGDLEERNNKWVDKIAPKNAEEWLTVFKKRKDIKKTADGSYDVKGDVSVLPDTFLELPVKLGKVTGNVICFGLRSLSNFPRVVNGAIVLINCTITEEEMRAYCNGNYIVAVGKSDIQNFRHIER